jgi:hypothetical protein
MSTCRVDFRPSIVHRTTRQDESENDMTQQDERAGTAAAAQLRADTHVRRLADLFDRRPDLAGVYQPADLTAEAVRWSA